MAVQPPARRRPWPPRRHPGAADARRRFLARLRRQASRCEAAGAVKKPSGSGHRGLTTRVKTARGRKLSSQRWLERQLNDPYVARSKQEGYRSRAAYKLMEIDDRYGLLSHGRR